MARTLRGRRSTLALHGRRHCWPARSPIGAGQVVAPLYSGDGTVPVPAVTITRRDRPRPEHRARTATVDTSNLDSTLYLSYGDGRC